MQTQSNTANVEPTPQGMEDIVTPDNFVQENSDVLSKSQMRWLIRQRGSNGLKESKAIILIGRRFYLQRSKFIKWFASKST